MRIAGALLLSLLTGAPALAQTPPAAPAESPDAAEAAGEPTLSITAHIEARSISVRQRGGTEARIWADPGGQGSWKLDRHGIPNPIPVGKTFHDVALDLDAHANVDEHGVSVGASAEPGKVEPPATNPPPH